MPDMRLFTVFQCQAGLGYQNMAVKTIKNTRGKRQGGIPPVPSFRPKTTGIFKKIFLLVTLVVLNQMAVKASHATFSQWYSVATNGTTYNQFGGAAEFSAQDGIAGGANVMPNSSALKSLHGNITDIPAGANINSVEIEIYGKRQYSGTTAAVYGGIASYYDSTIYEAVYSASQVYNLPVNSTSYQTYSFYVSNSEGNHEVTEYFRTHPFNPNTFTIIIGGLTGSGTESVIFYIDHVRFRINWEAYTATSSYSNIVVNPDNQEILMDWSGDTATYSANMSCEVGIYQECTRDGFSNIVSESSEATIILDERSKEATNSSKISATSYLGYGWGASNHSTWFASSVSLPYNPGYSCYYNTHTTCTTPEYVCNESGCHWIDTTVNMDQVNNGLVKVDHDTSFTEPEPTNPLSWVVWKIKQIAYDLFFPNKGFNNAQLLTLQNSLSNRVPFAYINLLSTLNTSTIATASSLTIPFNWRIDETHSYSANVVLTNELTPIRNVVYPLAQFLMYGIFLLYIFNFVKRVQL